VALWVTIASVLVLEPLSMLVTVTGWGIFQSLGVKVRDPDTVATFELLLLGVTRTLPVGSLVRAIL